MTAPSNFDLKAFLMELNIHACQEGTSPHAANVLVAAFNDSRPPAVAAQNLSRFITVLPYNLSGYIVLDNIHPRTDAIREAYEAVCQAEPTGTQPQVFPTNEIMPLMAQALRATFPDFPQTCDTQQTVRTGRKYFAGLLKRVAESLPDAGDIPSTTWDRMASLMADKGVEMTYLGAIALENDTRTRRAPAPVSL